MAGFVFQSYHWKLIKGILYFKVHLKTLIFIAEEMMHQLTVHTAFAKDPCSVPSTLVGDSQSPAITAFQNLMPPAGLHRKLHAKQGLHTDTYAYIKLKEKKTVILPVFT